MPGDAGERLMPLELGSAAAEVAVAIFDARGDAICNEPLYTATDRPAVEIILAATRPLQGEEAHWRADIFITAARWRRAVTRSASHDNAHTVLKGSAPFPQ